MKVYDKFKISGIKQFLDDIESERNIFNLYGKYLAHSEDEFDLEKVKNKSLLKKFLKEKGFVLKQDNSW